MLAFGGVDVSLRISFCCDVWCSCGECASRGICHVIRAQGIDPRLWLYERYLQEPARSNNHNIDVGVQAIVLRLQEKGEASHHKPDVSIYVSYQGCG